MPFQKSADPKIERISMKVTRSEKARIEAEAAKRHLTLSEYALRRMLGKQAPVRYDFEAIDALRLMAQELKDHYRTCNGRDEEFLQAFMDRLVLVTHAIWRSACPS